MNDADKDDGAQRARATAPVNEEPLEEETIDEPMDEQEEPVIEEVIAEEVTLRQMPGARSQAGEEDDGVPFWGNGQVDDLRSQWTDIQTGFVDDPRKAVQQADQLLETTLHSLTDNFNNRRSALQRDWERNKDLSTEDLRVAMKRYRSFLEGLLTLEP
jgi:hypothetical protein